LYIIIEDGASISPKEVKRQHLTMHPSASSALPDLRHFPSFQLE